MKKPIFNVIIFNFNKQEFESYDVMPYIIDTIQLDKLVTFNDFKEEIKRVSRYQFWSRCEYELLLVDFPCEKIETKIDIYDQIMMNIDLITQLIMDYIFDEDSCDE